MPDLRVLLVDDEEEFVGTLVERLSMRNIRAEGVLNGAAALKKVRNNVYDIVILDVRMPGMSGEDVLQQMRKLVLYVMLKVSICMLKRMILSLRTI